MKQMWFQWSSQIFCKYLATIFSSQKYLTVLTVRGTLMDALQIKEQYSVGA
jgi:hypothetical protein